MYKYKYTAKNFAFLISSVGEKTLQTCLNSILKQSLNPGQIILSIPENTKLKRLSKRIIVIKSKFRNQVHQRCLAKKIINQNVKILVQIDSNYSLEKDTLKKLIYLWSNQEKNVAGIGMIPSNYILPKINILQKLFISDSSKPGKILKSGYVSAWDITTKTKEVEWLNGGSVSWKLKYCKDIFTRRYPKIGWSVAEDLIYSYKKGKKYKLLISNKPKIKFINKQKKIDLFSDFKKGYFHSKIIKNLVYKNKDFSIFQFYYASLATSLLGIVFALFTFNLNKLSRYFGRLIGTLVKTYNYRIT